MTRRLHEIDEVNRAIEIDVEIGNAKYTVRTAEAKLLLCELKFQEGSLKDAGINGVTNEVLLAIVIDRLQWFQLGINWRCRQNAIAITKLEEALHWLRDRADEQEPPPKR
jgi:hypothetical protein